MYCTRKVTEDLTWVGADDRRLACLEGVYGVPTAFPTTHICSMTKRPFCSTPSTRPSAARFLKTSPTLWAEGSSII